MCILAKHQQKQQKFSLTPWETTHRFDSFWCCHYFMPMLRCCQEPAYCSCLIPELSLSWYVKKQCLLQHKQPLIHQLACKLGVAFLQYIGYGKKKVLFLPLHKLWCSLHSPFLIDNAYINTRVLKGSPVPFY